MVHNITFSPDAWADYLYWQSEDKKTLKRINKLLRSCSGMEQCREWVRVRSCGEKRA